MSNSIPNGYNPLKPCDDVEFMFRWVVLPHTFDPYDWISDGWDFAHEGGGVCLYRKLRKQYSYPVYKNTSQHQKFVNSLIHDSCDLNTTCPMDDDSFDSLESSLEEFLPENDNSTPLPSPLIDIKHKKGLKINKTIVLRSNCFKPVKPIKPTNSLFFDIRFGNKN